MTKTPMEIAEQIIKRYSPALILSADEQDILALAWAYSNQQEGIARLEFACNYGPLRDTREMVYAALGEKK